MILSANEDYQYKDYDEEYLENDDFDMAYPIRSTLCGNRLLEKRDIPIQSCIQ